MRICFASVAGELPAGVSKLLETVFRKVCRPSTEVTVKAQSPGLGNMYHLRIGYARMMNTVDTLEVFMEAEREGYDACVTMCGGDCGLREAREILNIPVAAPFESGLHYACLLGTRLGIVTLNEGGSGFEDIAKSYGLESRIIPRGVRGINLSTADAVTKGVENPTIVVQSIVEKAEELVQDGAEVIVIGCGLYGPMCTALGVSTVHGGQVPIIDTISVAVKTAEVMVELNGSLGLPSASKVGAYARPLDKHLQEAKSLFGR